MPFTVTTTVLSVTAGFNQMRSVNFNTETIKLVILFRISPAMSETALLLFGRQLVSSCVNI